MICLGVDWWVGGWGCWCWGLGCVLVVFDGSLILVCGLDVVFLIGCCVGGLLILMIYGVRFYY